MSIWTFTHQVAGTLAMWAIRQSPYACPDNLETVVKRFSELWPADAQCMTEWADIDNLAEAIQQVSEQIPELLAWNERKNGREGMGFSSRYDQPSPDDDFIDLSALWWNTARTIWAEEQTHAD
ncbi:hypothetical protein UFOVP5_21 [uncultured Caudovirales phage]|uniref:Uncharacterized protein n=1 Tax=uncultured Caudovirales phage TaxID=2100421 RepID=A0A6J5KFT8_9CAUD|nr:hypothetical protein UFOVP5_21 [uncultured Caudovirales phage]